MVSKCLFDINRQVHKILLVSLLPLSSLSLSLTSPYLASKWEKISRLPQPFSFSSFSYSSLIIHSYSYTGLQLPPTYRWLMHLSHHLSLTWWGPVLLVQAVAYLANLPGYSKGVSISNSHDWYHVLLHLPYSSTGCCFYY